MIGFFNIDKAQGMTAHDVVNRVRRIANEKQVGHGGTLDPMATGVLPVAVGKACRLLRFLPSDKTYTAEILLGTQTDTDDIEGKVLGRSDILPGENAVRECLGTFLGTQEQLPPAYSAIHHEGQRLYALARQGIVPDNVPKRTVTVHSLVISEISLPVVRIQISCSQGTYIRAIARDLGHKLSCGGCLKSLRRDKAGNFSLERAHDLNALKTLKEDGRLEEALVAPADALPMKPFLVDRQQAESLLMGRSLMLADDTFLEAEPVLALYEDQVLAVCRCGEDGRLKPEVVVGNAV